MNISLFTLYKNEPRISLLQKYRQIYQKQKNIKPLALTTFKLTRFYNNTGSFKLARMYYKDSIRLFRRLGDEANTNAATLALEEVEETISHLLI